jgi:hypothetical protein
MKTVIAVGFATMYGLALRLAFGMMGGVMEIMSTSFIVVAPVIIGFLTVILIPKAQVTSNTSAFFKPCITSIAILIITILCNIEGTICWFMIFPLFALLAGVGGIIAYQLKNRKTNTNKNSNKLNTSLVLCVPIVLGLIEGNKSNRMTHFNITKSLVIHNNTTVVWQNLTQINNIESTEKHASLAHIMGFPKHLSTIIDTLQIGGKRKATYENGLYFNETIAQLQTEKLLVLDIKTDPKNIPPTVMDEHIIIGGKHVDILQDTYTLTKLDNNTTKLSLSSKFFVNTPFNWYANIWAKYLMSNILESELELIKARASK